MAQRADCANVSISDPGDNSEPCMAYDIELWNEISLEQLDRSLIKVWQATVVIGFKGPDFPAGVEESELEKQAEGEPSSEPGQRHAIQSLTGMLPTPSSSPPQKIIRGAKAVTDSAAETKKIQSPREYDSTPTTLNSMSFEDLIHPRKSRNPDGKDKVDRVMSNTEGTPGTFPTAPNQTRAPDKLDAYECLECSELSTPKVIRSDNAIGSHEGISH